MASKENITPEDESEVMTITLNLDDGDVECAIVTIFDVDNQDYIALLPLDEDGENTDGEVWIYRYFENPDDPNEEPVLEFIDDDAEFDKVSDAFDEYLDGVEFDEMM